MENNANLINKYIDKLNNELCETVKKKVVLEAQLETFQEEAVQKEQDNFHALEAAQREVAESYEARITELLTQHQEEIIKLVKERAQIQDDNNGLRAQLKDKEQTEVQTNVTKLKKVSPTK